MPFCLLASVTGMESYNKIGIFGADQVSLASLLQSTDSSALEAQVCFKVLSDFTDQTLEREFANQQLRGLLISPRCNLKDEKKRLDYTHPGAVPLRSGPMGVAGRQSTPAPEPQLEDKKKTSSYEDGRPRTATPIGSDGPPQWQRITVTLVEKVQMIAVILGSLFLVSSVTWLLWSAFSPYAVWQRRDILFQICYGMYGFMDLVCIATGHEYPYWYSNVTVITFVFLPAKSSEIGMLLDMSTVMAYVACNP
ncbi:unnamed protein product [Ranitomeya imitator]|uniref:Uncharacterized protein n=1 Tax=Ranitomeya imitator TaxID=111125 RepID=A0ABN9ML85_9NEOB|nr:unnamed protein product [Ranitomeya imitator]